MPGIDRPLGLRGRGGRTDAADAGVVKIGGREGRGKEPGSLL